MRTVVMCKTDQIRTVRVHHVQLIVRGVKQTCENDLCPIRRPTRPSIAYRIGRQSLDTRAVGITFVYLIISIAVTGENDLRTVRRKTRVVIILKTIRHRYRCSYAVRVNCKNIAKRHVRIAATEYDLSTIR